MAITEAETWLTYAIRDDQVPWALVLAESLRKTGTTKRVGVITCKSVSDQQRRSLRQSFHDVHSMEEDVKEINGKTGNALENEIKAKIFAFSLERFEKCIFLEPSSLFLENSDWMFERNGSVIPLALNGNKKGVVIPSDYFLFKPCFQFFEHLYQLARYQNGWKSKGVTKVTVSYAKEWADNNLPMYERVGEENLGDLKHSVMQLSLETGHLLKKDLWNSPSIIHFVDLPLNKGDIVTQMQKFQDILKIGITEKAIIGMWLKLFEEKIVNPSPVLEKRNFHYQHEPVAIIGISCRLPGANNLEEFWNLLYSGQEGVREPPSFRWRKEHSLTPCGKKERSTRAGFLSTTVDEFDAKFFGVSPKEAVFMDPQTRLLHEVMWESLENGGVDPSSLYGSHTGIFTGSWMNDYKDIVQWSSSRDFFRTYMGNSIGAAAARLSFLLGLTGPSIATESGCSSAIVAVDMAIKSLRCGETNLALAGGVNLVLHPFTSNIMDYVIAPDGRCKTFDAKADGFGRAEACGFLVLKRLSDALRDRDHIWAMIRGSAVTQEGISRSLGTPTAHCEALAMQLALKNGGIRPEQVTFVETHGTGTSVGDPMEVTAIAKAYHSKFRDSPLIIGSVKTNVGHTESVSGITGIIKTVLAMEHELIPKHVNFDTLNPDINLDVVPAVIPINPIPWPKIKGQPRLAGVSSFGITGTDGHVILQEAPDYQLERFNVGLERSLHVLKISAKSKEALNQLVVKYQETLVETLDPEKFADLAFTANTGRASFDHRAFLLALNCQNAADAIQQNKLIRAEAGEAGQKICFLFTGQGSQYQGMARSMYETSPVFRFHFDHCAQTLKQIYNVPLCTVLWGSPPGSKELSRTIYSQTSIFCVEYCLLKLWESWGLKPDYVLGHSLGEFCAAVAAGILTFKDALKLVAVRSSLIDSLPHGSMLVLKANRKQVEDMMKSSNIQLDFAAVNSHEQTVVAGDTQMISDFLTFCKSKDLKGIILEATHAFHSSHMDPMLDDYRKVAESIKFKESTSIQYISGMEGKIRKELDADYWIRHTREKVNFLEACKTLKDLDCIKFLEVGPQPVLSTFVMQNLEGSQVTGYPSLRRNTNDWETILTSLGKLWIDGYKIDWHGFDKHYSRRKVACLPFYPFNRKSHWVECSESMNVMIHPLIGSQLNNASNINIFQNDLSINTVSYLKDHCIGNRIVFPGAGFTEMCLSAGYCVSNFLREHLEKPSGPIALENVTIEQPLELKEGKFCKMQVIVDLPDFDEESKGFRCKVFHKNQTDTEDSSGKWMSHSTGTFYPTVNQLSETVQNWNEDQVKNIIASKQPTQMDGFYKRIDGIGLKFGDTFRSIQKQWACPQEDFPGLDEIVAEINIPQDYDKYLLHPLIIDAMFQAQILSGVRSQKSDALRVPVRVGKLILYNCLDDSQKIDDTEKQSVLYIHAKWTTKDNCRLFVLTENFTPVAMMEDVELLETNMKTIQSVLEQQYSKIPDCWEETWKPIPGPSDHVELLAFEPVISTPEFAETIRAADKMTPEDGDNLIMLNRLVVMYTLRALFQLGWNPQKGEEFTASEFCEKYKIKPQFRQLVYFYFTMFDEEAFILAERSKGETWKVKSVNLKLEDKVDEEIDRLYNQLYKSERAVVIVKIYENVAKYLSKVLNGEENILGILFPMEPEKQELSAETYYKKHPGRLDVASKNLAGLGAYLSTLSAADMAKKTNNVLRVLEVGAGTGSLSIFALEEIKRYFGNNFEYYYTDISASFFAKADKMLEDYRGNVKFAVFNIEENPLAQGIPVNYFDCVFGTDVLHATRNIKECLINLRMTLAPHGVLNFVDTFVQDKGITFVFGLLEGYWRFEDFDRRPHHACVSVDEWKDVLYETGFIYAYSISGYLGTMGSIFAQANELPGYVEGENQIIRSFSETNKKNKWIIFSPEKNSELMKTLKTVLSIGGNTVDLILPFALEMDMEEDEMSAKMNSLFQTNDDEDLRGIIYAWGMIDGVQEQKDFARPFIHIAKYVVKKTKPPRIYILTKDVHAITDDSNNPFAATIHGMAKCLKNENSDLFVRYVDLEGKCDFNDTTDQVLYELAIFKETREKERLQVAYRNCKRCEARMSKITIQPESKSDLKLPPSTDRYQMVLPASRMISDLKFAPLHEESLSDQEIEVKTMAYALNFRDLFAILKPSEEFEKINTIGLDFAGVVCKVGEGVNPEVVKVGDRVAGCNMKEVQLPSHLVTDADRVMKIPDKMTFSEASTLPAVFATSIYCLVNVANLRKGETVLIHTGSGGVGLSAIQVAKHVGANIITTAGSRRKRTYLRSLGIEHVFHSRNTSYEENIMKATNGRGVDVVLNSITGPGFKEATLTTCAKNARFIEMSKLNVWTEEEVKSLRPDVKYSIVDLTKLGKEIWLKLQDKTNEYVESGDMTAIPFSKFDVLRIRQAFQYFQKAKHIGKVVVTMPEVKVESGKWKVKVPLLNANSTYLITGGLGGIGFAVCKWMLEKGATDIVLIGRSPPKPEIVKEIERLNQIPGNNVIVRLRDVANYDQLKELMDELTGEEFKPLRGIHHCAGVLRDNMYTCQNWESFIATFNPKVEGTWNLHQLTKHLQLEHFVLYSSMTAMVGTPGQSNHCAANCFEDSFAHYRNSLGLPATSINWGQWAQVGVAKEVSIPGLLMVSVARMLNGLEETLRSQVVQVAYGEFESFSTWAIFCPMFKYYLDERLLKSMNESKGDNQGQVLQSAKFWQEIDEAETREGKITVISGYLKVVLRNALRMEADEPIKDDANMQDLGVDSLMMIELKNSIQGLLGSRLTINATELKECQTIHQLSAVLVDKIGDNDQDDLASAPMLLPKQLEELLMEDCQLEESIKPDNALPICKPSEMKTVLLTGVTGQLGPYVLSQLCRIRTLEKIICLIQTREVITPMERLKATLKSANLTDEIDLSKVDCIRGNLAQEDFGLEKEHYDQLCTSVDGIVHLAAKIDHTEPYRNINGKGTDVRSVNVGGARRILKFAATQKTKYVYYASSIFAVMGGNNTEKLSDEWPGTEQIKHISETLLAGFFVSLFVNEMLMTQASERGIPCKVFRFPWVMGHSETGQMNYQNNKYILRLLTYLKLKAMPSDPWPAMVLPVDICADLSVKIFLNDYALSSDVYNITLPNPQLEAEFAQVAKNDFDTEVELVNWSNEEFFEKIYASDIPTAVLQEMYHGYDKMLTSSKANITFLIAKNFVTNYDNFFKNKKLEILMPGFEKDLPTSMDIIRKGLMYVKNDGVFSKFGL